MRIHTIVVLAASLTFSLVTVQARAADPTVTLMLGGKLCESHPEELDAALKKVAGVKSVDLTSMKGHALVKVDPAKAKPEQLVAAANGVKGSGWNCTAEIMK